MQLHGGSGVTTTRSAPRNLGNFRHCTHLLFRQGGPDAYATDFAHTTLYRLAVEAFRSTFRLHVVCPTLRVRLGTDAQASVAQCAIARWNGSQNNPFRAEQPRQFPALHPSAFQAGGARRTTKSLFKFYRRKLRAQAQSCSQCGLLVDSLFMPAGLGCKDQCRASVYRRAEFRADCIGCKRAIQKMVHRA